MPQCRASTVHYGLRNILRCTALTATLVQAPNWPLGVEVDEYFENLKIRLKKVFVWSLIVFLDTYLLTCRSCLTSRKVHETQSHEKVAMLKRSTYSLNPSFLTQKNLYFGVWFLDKINSDFVRVCNFIKSSDCTGAAYPELAKLIEFLKIMKICQSFRSEFRFFLVHRWTQKLCRYSNL